MRYNNPSMRRLVRKSESGDFAVETDVATHGGIIAKSLYFCGLTLLAGIATVLLMNYTVNTENAKLLYAILIATGVCALGMLACSLVVAFVPKTVKVLGSIFTILQGAVLGVAVYFIDVMFTGVALAAVLATVIVLIVAVVLNRALAVKVRNSFLRGLIIVAVSLVAVQLFMWLLSFAFKNNETYYTVYFWIQLGVSAFCVIYATVLLLMDLQSANYIVEMGVDKSCEWHVAFSLVTTLVYMYLAILELILRLVLLFKNNKK